MVHEARLELARHSTLVPKTRVSTIPPFVHIMKAKTRIHTTEECLPSVFFVITKYIKVYTYQQKREIFHLLYHSQETDYHYIQKTYKAHPKKSEHLPYSYH